MVAYETSIGKPYRIVEALPLSPLNTGRIDDPYLNEREGVSYLFENWDKPEARGRAMSERVEHLFDQAYTITLPDPYVYTFWWPWVKGFQGEESVGKHNTHPEAVYGWLDQYLKKELTGK